MNIERVKGVTHYERRRQKGQEVEIILVALSSVFCGLVPLVYFDPPVTIGYFLVLWAFYSGMCFLGYVFFCILWVAASD